MYFRLALVIVLLTSALAAPLSAQERRPLMNTDVFDLEFAVDPQISPDGDQVVYVRQSMDIMSDRALGNLWIVDADGSGHRPLVSGTDHASSPRWSPDGNRLAYVTRAGDRGAELFVRWMDSGQSALLSNLPGSPSSIAWSPDGSQIAFTMFVSAAGLTLASPPTKPQGADWAPPVKVINTLPYRADGAGYLDTGFSHLFVLPAEGGTPRQLTSGDYNHGGGFSWDPDGSRIVLSANRIEDRMNDPAESELWSVDVATGSMTALTSRDGPDFSPVFSPNGDTIAYLGANDTDRMSYRNIRVYLMDTDSGDLRELAADFDRSIGSVEWAGDSRRLLVSYDDHGKTILARLSTSGDPQPLLDDIGSANYGRPYTGGSYSVADNGNVAYTGGTALRPSDVKMHSGPGDARRLTRLNDDLFAQVEPATVEEFTWRSNLGNAGNDYDIQGWLVKPADYDASKRYPLILEIHGGPFAAYGPHFSPELQLYAAAGYVVLYSNPRGSTSYGYDFANEIHHNYPNQDYDDLMAGVDAAIEAGIADPEQLFVTGGSGGGVLSAWIVGKTDRFAAAVVQKPVINWASFALTSDGTPFFIHYWFGTTPWDDPMAYWERSPLSLVGNVSTPTMLMTGEQDWRTPISESEQFYQALKFRGVETAMVRVPERSHTIVGRPSHLIAKADNIIAWFERYRGTSGN